MQWIRAHAQIAVNCSILANIHCSLKESLKKINYMIWLRNPANIEANWLINKVKPKNIQVLNIFPMRKLA